MEPPENSVEARETSMQVQLAGDSSAVTRAEAERGVVGAHADIEAGRGKGYGVGFGYVKTFPDRRGLDGRRVEFAITNGERIANLHAVISGSRFATLGKRHGDVDNEVIEWMLSRLYEKAGAIPQNADRLAVLLSDAHPLHL